MTPSMTLGALRAHPVAAVLASLVFLSGLVSACTSESTEFPGGNCTNPGDTFTCEGQQECGSAKSCGISHCEHVKSCPNDPLYCTDELRWSGCQVR